eukprot:Ihof_evm11s79 gene=Ihof_evmTU11s79
MRKATKVRVSFVLRAHNCDAQHRFGVNALKVDSERGLLYTAGRDAIIRTWDINDVPVTDPIYLRSLEHHTDWVNDVVLGGLPDKPLLISASSDTTVKVWSAMEGVCLSTLRCHEDYVKCLAYAPLARKFASAGFDRRICLWDLENQSSLSGSGTPEVALEGHKDSIYCMDMNMNATIIVTGSSQKVVRIWDPRVGRKIGKLKGHADMVKAVVVSEDATKCLSGGSDGTIKLWDLGMQRCISTYDVHTDSVWTMRSNSEFTKVWSGGRDGRVCETDLATSDSLLLFSQENPVQTIEPGLDPQSMWVGTTQSDVSLWSWATAALDTGSITEQHCIEDTNEDLSTWIPFVTSPVATIHGKPGIINFHVLNDKQHVLTMDEQGNVSLWNILAVGPLSLFIHLPVARHVENLGKVNWEEEISKRKQLISIPHWFALDTKTGVITVHLDPPQCFAADIYRQEANLPMGSEEEEKVNLCQIMLRRLFAHWVKSRQESTSNQPNNHVSSNPSDPPVAQYNQDDYLSVPPDTPVLFSDESQGKGLALLRVLAGEMDAHSVISDLSALAPLWLTDCLFEDKYLMKEPPKLNFLLNPHPDSNLGILPQGSRLSANRILRVGRISRYVMEKLHLNPGADSPDPSGESRPENMIYIACNDK